MDLSLSRSASPIDAAPFPTIMWHYGPPRFGLKREREASPMFEALQERVNADQALIRRGRYLTTTFLVETGETAWLISVFEGRIVRGPFVMPSSSFALRASEAEWRKFFSPRPPPGSNDLMALIRRRVLTAEGDLKVFMAHLRYFKEVLAKLRPVGDSA
jgi:hypothetical protein